MNAVCEFGVVNLCSTLRTYRVMFCHLYCRIMRFLLLQGCSGFLGASTCRGSRWILQAAEILAVIPLAIGLGPIRYHAFVERASALRHKLIYTFAILT